MRASYIQRHLSEGKLYFLLFGACVIVSLSGIPWAIWISEDPADGGRFGAWGVVLAVAFLFIKRDYGAQIHAVVTGQNQTLSLLEQLNSGASIPELIAKLNDTIIHIHALEKRLQVDDEGGKIQTIVIALATIVTTIVWANGDKWAKFGILYFHGPRWV